MAFDRTPNNLPTPENVLRTEYEIPRRSSAEAVALLQVLLLTMLLVAVASCLSGAFVMWIFQQMTSAR